MPLHPLRHFALLATLGASLAAQAALPTPPPPLAKEEFAARRRALAAAAQQAHPDRPVVVMLRGAAGRDDMGAFAQEQDFLYLSGVAEPELALLLVPGADGTLAVDELLVPPFSRFAATWDGDFLAPGEASAARTGFASCGNVRALGERLDALLAAGADGQRPVLVTTTQPAPRTGSTPRKAADAAAAVAKDPFDGRPSRAAALGERLQQRFPGLEIRSVERLLRPLRTRKSPAEIALLRAAAQLTAEGHLEAMKSAAPGRFEYQLAAAARFVFTLRGAGPDAYGAIVGGGPNGCVLHYNALTRQLQADDLVVMDYAPTLHGYAVDVTRTFPASGTFSAAQRRLVQDVHDVQRELLAMVKPGASLAAIGARCAQLLQQKGYASDHGPCHHVGLAVHDPEIDVLEAGMVITVEPGAYLRKQGMGCRIEDTVLVTADGCEVLSAAVPSLPDAIEAVMQQPGAVDRPVGSAR